MTRDDYKPGKKLLYEEDGVSFPVEVIENKSDQREIGYQLKVVGSPSVKHPFLKAPEIGEVFDFSVSRSHASQFRSAFGQLVEIAEATSRPHSN